MCPEASCGKTCPTGLTLRVPAPDSRWKCAPSVRATISRLGRRGIWTGIAATSVFPVLGSVRLYLNQAHPRIAAVASGQSDPELDGVREALGFDVVRQLIAGALADREFLADPDGFPAGSVGATVRLLCRGVLFPYSSVEELAHLALSRPSRFEADLQAAVSLYWDPGG